MPNTGMGMTKQQCQKREKKNNIKQNVNIFILICMKKKKLQN